MGPLRVSNVLRPDNRVAGPWVGWAHGGVCSVCGRAQWPWRVLCTAGVAGVRVYFWARVRWVFGSSGVGAFCVWARLGSCCAGVFLLRAGPCCVARIPGAVGASGVACILCAALGFPFCYEVDSSPLFNFNRIFPPLPRSVPKPCAETSYLRVQCLCLATLGYAILCAGRRGYNT